MNEIWGFESTNHGDSAIINEGKLGFIRAYCLVSSQKSQRSSFVLAYENPTDTWAESGRDLINFILYYLPANPAAAGNGELPLHLERLPEAIAQDRRQNGLASERALVGIAHSAGAASMYVCFLNLHPL